MDQFLKVTVRYDGTGFAGWQIQPNAPTVQGELERVLAIIAGRPVAISGASRTDAGVHALGQVFTCHWPEALGLDRLQRSVSKMLRPAIRIEKVELAPPGFDARRSPSGKRYAYSLDLNRCADPFSARYAWCIPWHLDLARLEAVAQHAVGTHDFAGYQAANATSTSTVRTVHAITLLPGVAIGPISGPNLYRLEFHGDAFLYKMIRNLTGTFVDIARGLLPESAVESRLAHPGPYHGHTAPAQGLTLLEIFY